MDLKVIDELYLDKTKMPVSRENEQGTDKKNMDIGTPYNSILSINILSGKPLNVNTKLSLNISCLRYTSKPKTIDISNIVKDLKQKNSVKEITVEQLINTVTKGVSVTAGTLFGTKKTDWTSQQVFIIDIDNDNENEKIMFPEDCQKILNKAGIPVVFMYYTFSHTEKYPKFRIVTVSDQKTTDPQEAEQIIKYIISLLPQADKACCNLDRIFFGTNKGLVEELGVNYLCFNLKSILEKSKKQKVIEIKTEKDKIQENATCRKMQNFALSCDDNAKQYKSTSFDLKREYDTFNLLKYVEDVTKQKSKVHSRQFVFDICPICGKKTEGKHFQINPEKNKYVTHALCGRINPKGGNILTFLMETQGFSEKEAREYFRRELCHDGENMDLERKKWLMQIKTKKQIFKNKNEKPNQEKDYLYVTSKGSLEVSTPLLAEYIRNTQKYIFVKNKTSSGIDRYFYINGYYKKCSDDEVKGIIKTFIPTEIQRMKDIKEVMELLYTDLKFIEREKLNPENFINFENGLFDISTWEIKKHSPEVYTTIRIPVKYNPDYFIKNSIFDKYLDSLTEENAEVKRLLLQFMGVAISNICGYKMKKGLFMIGRGNTGKSQLKELLVKLLGVENVSGIDLEDLEQRFGTSQIYNKRLVGSNDMSYATVRELKQFKLITGGDTIRAEYKGQDGFDFKFNGIVWFCANKLPKFSGDRGDWVYDRIIVVNCNNVISIEKQDKDLINKLYAEKDYIINLCLSGLKQVIDNNYNYDIPEVCKNNTEKYKIENDSFLKFLKDCTTETNEFDIYSLNPITHKILYDVYKLWCKDNQIKFPEPKKDTIEIIKQKGFDDIKKGTGNFKGQRLYTKFTLLPFVLEEYKDYINYNFVINSCDDNLIPPIEF